MRLIAILLCSLFSTTAFSAPTATDYGLKVAGVDVTSDNCADLSVIDGVKGTVSYAPATKTLTLQDATIDKADEFTIENKSIDGLKVNIVGTNNLSTTKFASISIEKTTTFQGSGTLKVKGKSYGISFGNNNLDVIIRDCKMYIEGEWGIDGFFVNTNLTIINANIEINSLKEAITRIDNLSLQRCAITEPAGAIFDASQRCLVVGGAYVSKLVIAPEKPVFKVAGVEVTDANSGNLTTIAGVEGKASYDPETQTLTLDNATITTNAVAGIANESATGLQVKLVGNNTITSASAAGMVIGRQTRIVGDGKLKVTSTGASAILMQGAPLNIEGCSVVAEGKYGIYADKGDVKEVLTVRTASVEAQGASGSIAGLSNLLLVRCIINQPQGAAYDKALKGVAKDGGLVTDRVVIGIEKYGLLIGGIDVTSANYNAIDKLPGVTGSLSYDPAKKILRMVYAAIPTDDDKVAVHNQSVDGLKIEMTGENAMSGGTGCILERPTTITGSGNMTITGTKGCGVALKNTMLTIKGIEVRVSGATEGISGDKSAGCGLAVNDAHVEAEGSQGSVVGISKLQLNTCYIKEPSGAAFDATLKGVAAKGALVKEKVVMTPPIKYGVMVAGVEVTVDNCADLSVIDGVKGTVSYDPATKTLTLKDATIDKPGDDNIYNYGLDGLKIKVLGTNSLTSDNDISINLKEEATFVGNGTLKIKSNYYGIGIRRDEVNCTISECKMYIESVSGIDGNWEGNDLTIRGAYIELDCRDDLITCITNLHLVDCEIKQPKGAVYDTALKAIVVDGVKQKGKLVIEPTTDGIGTIDADVPARKQGIYTLQGVKVAQDWNSLPPGIYIRDGKKMIKR
mgnify:CR=1 FL=1